MTRLPLLMLLLVLVGGCTVGPNYQRPPVDEPAAFRGDTVPGAAVVDLAWWELFEDPVLQDLIETALANNRDLRTAVARIDEAAATLGIVRADLYPRVYYGGDGSGSASSAGEGGTDFEGTLFLSAGWQVDLWGRFRRANEAALQDLLATEAGMRGVTVSLVASVASSYLLLRDLDNRLEISEKTVQTRLENVDIIRARFAGGSVTQVDLSQSIIQLSLAEVAVQTFVRLRRQTENSINLLLGSPPAAIERGRPLAQQLSAPAVPAGLPSALLDQRPDILVAERQLHAQTARIGVAEALKYPQFNLTGDLGTAFADISAAFFDLGAQIVGPLFNSGENSRRVDAEVARTQQLLNNYEQAVLNAYREVEDALIAISTYELELAARQRQVEAAQAAADLSWVRYETGMTSYLEILESQRSLFDSQLQTSETFQLRLNAVVALYAALGGGWSVEEPAASEP